MTTYVHSGTLGDLIYSLSIVKKMGGGNFLVALNNLESVVAQYSRNPSVPESVDPAHQGRFTQTDYELLKPLLKRQSYIESVNTWQAGDAKADVDLDQFRGTLFRTFEGNYVEAYHRAFDLPFSMADYDTAWLEAEKIITTSIVISRTFRYRDPDGDAFWADMVKDIDLSTAAVFVGTPAEHKDFERATYQTIPYRPVTNFLELAGIVNGADMIMANQNFVYSLAMGLGKDTLLETIKIKPLRNNECFFPRTNCQYF